MILWQDIRCYRIQLLLFNATDQWQKIILQILQFHIHFEICYTVLTWLMEIFGYVVVGVC